MPRNEALDRIEIQVSPDTTRGLDQIRGPVHRATYVRTLLERHVAEELAKKPGKKPGKKKGDRHGQ